MHAKKILLHLFDVDIHLYRTLQFKYHACPIVLNHALFIQHHAMFRLDSNVDVLKNHNKFCIFYTARILHAANAMYSKLK